MLGALLRSWRRSRLLTAQFAITIAVGMGAAVALASFMLALGYQPLPYRDPGRLVAVWEHAESGAVRAISGPDVAEFAGASHNIFASLGAFTVFQRWLLDRRGATRIQACPIQASALSDLRTYGTWFQPISRTALGRLRQTLCWAGFEAVSLWRKRKQS